MLKERRGSLIPRCVPLVQRWPRDKSYKLEIRESLSHVLPHIPMGIKGVPRDKTKLVQRLILQMVGT